MKFLIITIVALLFSTHGVSSEEDGGWSSSGGGEYIVTKNNPWFMGTEPVKWCIDHGGEENFSLSFDESKVEIEKGIKVIISQLRRTNDSTTAIFLDPKHVIFGNCGVKEKNSIWKKECKSNWNAPDAQRSDLGLKKISDNYSYVKSCQDAQLIFILGNTKSKLVKTLVNRIGKKKFRNLVGTTIRTSYDSKRLRGKGFIYIASDAGRLSYNGDRNQVFSGPSIWNIKKYLPPKMSVPPLFVDDAVGVSEEILVDKYMMQPLAAVIAHEVAHVLGFRHQVNGLMGEDFPAKVVSNGLISHYAFKKVSGIIKDNLHDDFKSLSFDFNLGQLRMEEFFELRKSSPTIFKMITPTGPEDFYVNNTVSFDFIEFPDCEAGDRSDECKYKGKMNLFKREGKKFVKQLSYEAKYEQLCARPEVFDYVTLRIKSKKLEMIQIYNEETRKWEPSEVLRDVLMTNQLTTLWSKKYCGYITSQGKKIGFEFMKSYNSNITLTFKDLENQYELKLSSSNELRVNYNDFSPGIPKIKFNDF